MEIITKRKGQLYLAWRKAVFDRDDYICQHCGEKDKKLHPHHIKTWEEAPELRIDINNGLTLCTSCHNKHHHIGREAWNKGEKLPLEQRKKMAEAKIGKPCANGFKKGLIPWNKGKKGIAIGTKKGTKFSEEHKRKMSEAASKRQITEETREKLRNRVITDETREKLRNRPQSDEKRAKLKEKTTLYWANKRQASFNEDRVS